MNERNVYNISLQKKERIQNQNDQSLNPKRSNKVKKMNNQYQQSINNRNNNQRHHNNQRNQNGQNLNNIHDNDQQWSLRVSDEYRYVFPSTFPNSILFKNHLKEIQQ